VNIQKKYTQFTLENISRHSPEWKEFVNWQKERIMERLTRYNDVTAAKEKLKENFDLTPYQHYKINTVSPFLLEALERIQNGTYGICKYCGKEIPVYRLLLVAPALQCVECENSKK
jgi:RNA polymerase-binding transcription factor DksA